MVIYMFKDKPTKRWENIRLDYCKIDICNPSTKDGRMDCFMKQAGKYFQCRSCILFLNMDTLSKEEHDEAKKKYFAENENGR